MPFISLQGIPKDEDQKKLLDLRSELIQIDFGSEHFPPGNNSLSCVIQEGAIKGPAKFISIFVENFPANPIITSGKRKQFIVRIKDICEKYYPEAGITVTIREFTHRNDFVSSFIPKKD